MTMFGRRTSGSVVCVSCGNLVGVNDDTCYMCGRRNPGLWGYAPLLRKLGNDMGFVPLVVTASIGLYVAALLASGGRIRMDGLFSFLAPSTLSLFLFGASGAMPVFEYGRWWTIFSAGWLHAGILHILFNLLWIRQLGPVCAEMYGAGRMVIIYILAGALGFAASSTAGVALAWVPVYFLRGAGFTVGASAGIFGLLGALVYYGQRTGSSLTKREALQYALMMGVFGLIMPGVDNWAHAGGFAGGWLMGRVLDPLKPERVTHVMWAGILIVASAVSVVVSILHGLALFRQ
jgi:rhomboid protease GluP